MAFEDDLPDELRGGRQGTPEPERAAERLTLLNTLGEAIGRLRDDAVKARMESGIEDVWTECEEAYQGIDDANRAEFSGARWVKPTSPQGPLTRATAGGDPTKSTAYFRLTTRYVDMATAKLCEAALALDDKPFSLKATPDPDLVDQKENAEPAVHPVTGAPGPTIPGPAGQPVPMTMGQVAHAIDQLAATYAEKAEKRIWDWMIESKFPTEMRKVIHDSARLGTGVLKGPYPDMQTSMAMQKEGDGLKLTIVEKSVPAQKWIDLWNLFPAPECGEDIHTGDHIFERDFISRRTLKGLKGAVDAMGEPIYLASQIDKVLEEGPDKCNVEPGNPNHKADSKRLFTIWYFTGMVKRSELATTGAIGLEEMPDELDEVYAVVTLVNDTVIRATVNPLEKSGNFPYRVFPWSRRAGHWSGVGVAEQVSMPQRAVNASIRSMFNNAGVSGGVQIVMDSLGVIPADGNFTITPNKVWKLTGEGILKASDAFAVFTIPNITEQMMTIIQFNLKAAEELSNIPLISQGQQGEQVPQTFGQAELQNSNANTLLRNQGLRLDDFVTEPLVTDYYEMLLLDPEVPDDEKGDLRIIANGTSALVEKAIQEQTAMIGVQMSLNPAFGINPEKAFAEWWKTKRMDPTKIQLSDEEKAAKSQQPPPEDPRIAAAKIQAEATKYRTDKDTDRDVQFQAMLNERARIDAQANEAQLELKRELEKYKIDRATELGNAKLQQELEALKAELAQTTMKLTVQKELSADALAAGHAKHVTPSGDSQVATPPTEPAGRAEAGQAFAE